MKIAVYCNLERGGALNFLIETIKELSKENDIDIYCFNNNVPNGYTNNIYCYNLKKTKNILHNLLQTIFELRYINKKIAQKINKQKYDLILVHPCIITQTPYVLKYIKNKDKCIYFFAEPKREFYENTSFDYHSIKRVITRIIRIPIKLIDRNNCQFARHIITNSFYSRIQLKKIYNKESTVIYPGLKQITPKKLVIKNNKKILSVGMLSKIKGHDFSLEQIKNLSDNITILGRNCNESSKILSIASNNNIFVNLVHTENDQIKNDIYKYFSIFLANQLNEPFGITTLEATENDNCVLGKNDGGTPEIIRNGINGYLYTSSKESKEILRNILNKEIITLYKTNTIDWKYTTDRILEYYYHHIKHEKAY